MKSPIGFLFPFAAIALAVLAGCAKHEAVPEPVRPVQLTQVTLGAVANVAGFSGEVKPRHEADLAFRIGGIERYQSLFAQKFISGSALDQKENAFNANRAK